MLVRKLSPRDRFKQALRNSDRAFPDSFDIDYVKQKYPKLADSRLSERLGSAIAKRRQFIKYCRDHRSRLGADETTHDATATEQLSSKATTFAPGPNFNLDLQEEEYEKFSLSDASTIADFLSNLTLPRLASTQEPFECPICFTLQSFQSEKSWQYVYTLMHTLSFFIPPDCLRSSIHAFRDLKAYVCTLGGVECDAEFFEDRDSWFEHELQKHRSQYTCILCKCEVFSFEDLQTHILRFHGSFSDTQLKMFQEAGRERLTEFKARDCPFCDEWAETLLKKLDPNGKAAIRPIQDIVVNHNRFKRHVATHQEQLAIFALPRATEDENTPDPRSIADSSATASSIASVITVDRDPAQDTGAKRGFILPRDIMSPFDDLSDIVINSSGKQERSPSPNFEVGAEQKEQGEFQKLVKPVVESVHNEVLDTGKVASRQVVISWTCVSVTDTSPIE
jgi:hypothetical protein